LIACRAFLHGNGAGVGGGNGLRSAASMSAFSGHPAELRMDQAHADGASPTRGNAKKVIHMLRDLLYSTRKNLYELFRTGDASRKTLDLSAFKGIIDFASKGNVAAGDAETAFSHLVHGTGEMTFEVFERAFRSEVPTGVEFETVVIRRVREWMFRNRLSSEMAFESLCRASGRFSERTMPRASFHEGFQHYEISLSAAQIDALFSSLSGGKTEEISLSHWQSRIYEDGDNPLQAMRETVTANRLSQDDLMFTMKLRVWDDPLDGHKFLTAIRLLDATVSDAQAKSLFSTLKNNDGKVDVHVLVRNLTGKEFETVDFRNKIFAKIYAEVFPNKEEKMIQLLQEEDTENMGLIRGA
jgi:Ca2+-binding EF-hand superfamily protein